MMNPRAADLQRFMEPSTREAREQRQRDDDRKHRERLEKGAPSERADLGRIVGMTARDVLSGHSLESTLGELRQSAQGFAKRADAQKSAPASEGYFNRLHPRSALARALVETARTRARSR